jgi:hypothetical protein
MNAVRDPRPTPFEIASRSARQGLAGEFLAFMRDNAKWWLTPFLAVFALLGAALALGATGAAPFVYTIF